MFDMIKAMVEKVFGGSSSTAIADSVLISLTDKTNADAWTMINGIYDKYLVPFGLCILMFMFFYALMDKYSVEGLSFEVVGKMLIKLLLLAGFMETGLTIAKEILDLMALVITQMKADVKDVTTTNAVSKVLTIFFGSDSPSWDGLFDWILELNDCLLPLLMLLVPWLVTLVCEVLIQVVTLTRQVEIFVRAAFLPVALGDSYNGLSSGAVRYLKSFLAVCLQGAMIIVIVRIADMMSASYLLNLPNANAINTIMGVIVKPVIFRVAACGLVLKSMPLAKEVCGVG